MLLIQKMIRLFGGYVKVRVEGYSAERFLNLCSYRQIDVWGLVSRQNSYEMYMTLKGFRSIRPIVRKTHTKVLLIKRYGLPFFLHQNRYRAAFAAGALLCTALLFFYSGYIWDIHFEGNEKWTEETLLEFLETKNIAPGMPKKDIDCTQIVKDIRQQYDDIIWVSASIDGSRLRIQIKENEDTFLQENPKETENQQLTDAAETVSAAGTDLVASANGVITSMITRTGTPLVHVGDTVEEGQILVTGRVEILNDTKEVTGYQYEQADADIYADTQMEYEDTISRSYLKKNYDPKRTRDLVYLKVPFGKKTFGKILFGSERHSYKKWETYTSEQQVKLGENFYLPVFYGKIHIRSYTEKKALYTKKEVQEILSLHFQHFSEDLKEKGIQISGNDVKIHVDENLAAAKGTLYLNQQITRAADTEILEIERNEINESIGTDD